VRDRVRQPARGRVTWTYRSSSLRTTPRPTSRSASRRWFAAHQSLEVIVVNDGSTDTDV
jgi:hypothetical protein